MRRDGARLSYFRGRSGARRVSSPLPAPGDARCPHCRAPQPAYGLTEHAWDFPVETGRWREEELRRPASKAELVALARQIENAWIDAQRRRNVRADQLVRAAGAAS